MEDPTALALDLPQPTAATPPAADAATAARPPPAAAAAAASAAVALAASGRTRVYLRELLVGVGGATWGWGGRVVYLRKLLAFVCVGGGRFLGGAPHPGGEAPCNVDLFMSVCLSVFTLNPKAVTWSARSALFSAHAVHSTCTEKPTFSRVISKIVIES